MAAVTFLNQGLTHFSLALFFGYWRMLPPMNCNPSFGSLPTSQRWKLIGLSQFRLRLTDASFLEVESLRTISEGLRQGLEQLGGDTGLIALASALDRMSKKSDRKRTTYKKEFSSQNFKHHSFGKYAKLFCLHLIGVKFCIKKLYFAENLPIETEV